MSKRSGRVRSAVGATETPQLERMRWRVEPSSSQSAFDAAGPVELVARQPQRIDEKREGREGEEPGEHEADLQLAIGRGTIGPRPAAGRPARHATLCTRHLDLLASPCARRADLSPAQWDRRIIPQVTTRASVALRLWVCQNYGWRVGDQEDGDGLA